MNRVGVFVCHCGTNIAGKVDVKGVAERASRLDGVAYATDTLFACSEPAQRAMAEAVRERGLTHLVVAACTPAMHLRTFRGVARRAGLDPGHVAQANVREGCSWVTEDEALATEKAFALLSTAVRRVQALPSLTERRYPVESAALVVGGGIAGITAALEVASAGFPVHLVERGASIGGHMALYDKTFPTLDCASCILTPKMTDILTDELITIHSQTTVAGVSGAAGGFEITLEHAPRHVALDKCTDCGECERVCPGKYATREGGGLETRRSISKAFAQAVPPAPFLDEASCRFFTKGSCRACERVCPVDAVNLEEEGSTSIVRVGFVVLATGFALYDAAAVTQYGYGRVDGVVTSLQLERMLHPAGFGFGERTPRRVAIVHCVGSRDENHAPYCSSVCCMYSLKLAHLVRERTGAEVRQYYTDMRASGKGYEEFMKRTLAEGVVAVRGKPAEVLPSPDGPVVVCENTLSGAVERETFDLVALSPAMTPDPDTTALARAFSVSRSADGFLAERHPKLDPVASTVDGVFVAGACVGPKDIPASVAQAGAAAARVVAALARGEIVRDNPIAVVERERCSGCKACVEVCPVGALTFDGRYPSVVEAACTGCSACTSVCLSRAITVEGADDGATLVEAAALLTDV